MHMGFWHIHGNYMEDNMYGISPYAWETIGMKWNNMIYCQDDGIYRIIALTNHRCSLCSRHLHR